MLKKRRLFFLGVVAVALLLFSFFYYQRYMQLHAITAIQSESIAAVLPGVVIALTNSDRVKNGALLLTENPLLTKAAQMKADDMLARQYYSHTTPEGKTPLDFLDAVGYHYQNVGENLDLTYVSTEEDVESAWMNSPEHRANILLPQFTEIGVGVTEGEYQGEHVTFVAELFATPLPAFVMPQKVDTSITLVTHTPTISTSTPPSKVHKESVTSTLVATSSEKVTAMTPISVFTSTTTEAVPPILNTFLSHVSSTSISLPVFTFDGVSTSSMLHSFSLKPIAIPVDSASLVAFYNTVAHPILIGVEAVTKQFIAVIIKLISH